MSYTFETDGFSFSSSNPAKVETVKRWFTEGGFTVDKIKKDIIVDRHNIMVSLTCWGYCELAQDYWLARELKQNIKKDYVGTFRKGSVGEFWAQGYKGDDFATKQVKNKTGWII